MEYSPLIVVFVTVVAATEDFNKYLSNDELYDHLREVNDIYQNISHLYTIGTSSMGDELWVLMISLASIHESGIPNVKIVGNIHGNEPVGRELIIFFIKMLLKGYTENNEDVIHLLKTTKIHFLPSANPDGFTKAIEGECYLGPGRKNANNIDLNRDFLPAFFPDDDDLFRQRETETTAIVNWMTEIHFILSVSIHSGSLVVVYPFDESSPGSNSQGQSSTDDNDIFKHLALVYASNTKGTIYEICPEGRHFENGITNGASWYSARGTMGDYNYFYHGCLELTVEISCCKYPHPSKMGEIIENHHQALMAVLKEAQQGVKGKVTCGGVPAVAFIQVIGRNITSQTTDEGEYWRILLPGRYFLQVESRSCRTEIVILEIPKRKTRKYPEPVILNIHLKKLWEGINDEIEFGILGNDEELNITVQDNLHQTSDTSERRYSDESLDKELIHRSPLIESSISLSTTLSASTHLILYLCWVLGLYRR